MDEKKVEYIKWVFINIVLPVSPVLLKAVIAYFGKGEILKVSIFDSVELLYYNLFVSITFINILRKKSSITVGDCILHYTFGGICIVDLIVITLIYIGMASSRCTAFAGLLSISVPIFVSVYYYSQMGEEG